MPTLTRESIPTEGEITLEVASLLQVGDQVYNDKTRRERETGPKEQRWYTLVKGEYGYSSVNGALVLTDDKNEVDHVVLVVDEESEILGSDVDKEGRYTGSMRKSPFTGYGYNWFTRYRLKQ